MIAKTLLFIIVSSLLLFAVAQTPVHSDMGAVPARTFPPPPPENQRPESPDEAPPPPSENEPPSNGDNPWQAILESLQAAWEGITGWLEEAVGELQEGIAQLINQFVQGLIDEVVRQATQMFQDLLNQACGAAFWLPAGALTGVWAFSQHKNRQ